MRYPEFTLHHMLVNAVDRYPDKAVIVSEGQSHTYEQLHAQSSSLARALVEEGLNRGDRVGIYLDKSWDAVVAIGLSDTIASAQTQPSRHSS